MIVSLFILFSSIYTLLGSLESKSCFLVAIFQYFSDNPVIVHHQLQSLFQSEWKYFHLSRNIQTWVIIGTLNLEIQWKKSKSHVEFSLIGRIFGDKKSSLIKSEGISQIYVNGKDFPVNSFMTYLITVTQSVTSGASFCFDQSL